MYTIHCTFNKIIFQMSLEECPQYTDCIFKKVPDFISSSDRFLIISGKKLLEFLTVLQASS